MAQGGHYRDCWMVRYQVLLAERLSFESHYFWETAQCQVVRLRTVDFLVIIPELSRVEQSLDAVCIPSVVLLGYTLKSVKFSEVILSLNTQPRDTAFIACPCATVTLGSYTLTGRTFWHTFIALRTC